MNIKAQEEIVNGMPVTTMTVKFTVTDGQDKFNWDITVPIMSEKELKTYLESRLDEFRCKIYKAQYPGAVPGILENETQLDAWRRWESNGCRNPDETIIQKIAWNNSFEYCIHSANFKALKNAKVKRLLKKGLVAEAIKVKGGL